LESVQCVEKLGFGGSNSWNWQVLAESGRTGTWCVDADGVSVLKTGGQNYSAFYTQCVEKLGFGVSNSWNWPVLAEFGRMGTWCIGRMGTWCTWCAVGSSKFLGLGWQNWILEFRTAVVGWFLILDGVFRNLCLKVKIGWFFILQKYSYKINYKNIFAFFLKKK